MDVSMRITFLEFCLASAYWLRKDLELPTEKLICLYKECIEMAKHCHDIITMVNSCIQFVLLSNSIGRHADSLRCLKEILPSAVVIPECELLLRQRFSLTYKELKEYDNVVLHARKCIDIARSIGYKKDEILGHILMGCAQSLSGSYDIAIDCFKRSLENVREIDSTKGDLEMMAYECLMHAYKCMQNYDDIILNAHKLLVCANKINDKQTMVTAYLELGRAHLYLNHYQDATDYGKKCFEIAREIEDRRSEVEAYLLKGRAYQGLSDYDNAIIYCKKCTELAITIGNEHAEIHVYSLLGSIYYSLKKYDEALENFKQCIDKVNSIGCEKETGVRACLSLGQIYKTLKQYDDAVDYYKKCIVMAQETSEKCIEAQACLGLSSLYRTLDEKDNAIQYGKKCIDLAQETGDKITETKGHFLLAMGYLYSAMQLNDAFLTIDAGMALATELGDKKTKEGFENIISDFYIVVGLFDKACEVPSTMELFEVPTCSEDDLLEELSLAIKKGDERKKERALMRLYRFYFFENEHEKAIHYLERLKDMDINRSSNLIYLVHMGQSYQMLGQNDKALGCYEEGLPTAESCSNYMLRSMFFMGFGKLLFLLNRELNLAERYLREAIRCFEAIFTTLGSSDEFKISIFDMHVQSYKALAIVLLNNSLQIKEALLVLDCCRARALKDLMISNYNGWKKRGAMMNT